MKKILALIMTALLCLMVIASAEELAGGWTMTEEPTVTEAAQKAFDIAMEDFVGVGYTPIVLLATQVVAGTNYCILCSTNLISSSPVHGYALVYVYADLNGGAELLGIRAIDGVMIGELRP